MHSKDASLLNISTYTNYIVHNSLREVIELKTEVKLTGKVLNKSRYAILTTQRLLLFSNRENYLNKKKPTHNYLISDHDFQVNRSKLQILAIDNVLLIELDYPTAEVAIHWWESIQELKSVITNMKLNGFGAQSGMIDQSMMLKNSMINKSNIFSSSIIEGINEGNSSLNIFRERKDSKTVNSSGISSVIFNNGGKKSNNKKVGFKEEIRKEYRFSKDKRSLEEADNGSIEFDSRRNSLETQRDFYEGRTIINEDEDSNHDYEESLSNADKDEEEKENQSISKKEVNSIEILSKEEEDYKDQEDKQDTNQLQLINVKKSVGEEERVRKEGENKLPDLNSNSVIMNKLESTLYRKVSKDNSYLASNNSNNKKSISSHSKSFSIENSKSCSMMSKDDTNSIKIGFINAFDTRKKKSQMPPAMIYTERKQDSIENPEKEYENSLTSKGRVACYNPHAKTKQQLVKEYDTKTKEVMWNNNTRASKPLFPIGYHKKTMSQYANIPSKVIPALNLTSPLNPQPRSIYQPHSQAQSKPNNTKDKAINIKNEADHTTIHIFRNEDEDYDFDDKDIDDNNSHNVPLTMRETNSIVFIEKIYKPQASSPTVTKPSRFIEQLLENRYSKIMLRISLKEGSHNSTFVTKLYDFLTSILSTYNSKSTLLKCLFEKLPSLIRDRLNKSDILLLQKHRLTERSMYNSERLKEMKQLIQRDMRTIKMIFDCFMKEYHKANTDSDLISRQEVFNRELDRIIEELN